MFINIPPEILTLLSDAVPRDGNSLCIRHSTWKHFVSFWRHQTYITSKPPPELMRRTPKGRAPQCAAPPGRQQRARPTPTQTAPSDRSPGGTAESETNLVQIPRLPLPWEFHGWEPEHTSKFLERNFYHTTWYTLITYGLLLNWGVFLFVILHVLFATNAISFTHISSFPMATFQEQENTQQFYSQSINHWFSCQLHKCSTSPRAWLRCSRLLRHALKWMCF